MDRFIKKECKTIKELKELAKYSYLTFEGMKTDDENLNVITDWLDNYKATKENSPVTYITVTGDLFNRAYKLTENNAYPVDLTILIVTNINASAITIPRFDVGGRWLDDIVDNNVYREKEKKLKRSY